MVGEEEVCIGKVLLVENIAEKEDEAEEVAELVDMFFFERKIR